MASLPHLYVHKPCLCASGLLLVCLPLILPCLPLPLFPLHPNNSRFLFFSSVNLTDTSNSYPETSNLTLEEVDYLFVKDGSHGIHKFTSKSQPVKISLSGDVEHGAEKMSEEKRGSEGGAAFVEDVNKV